MNKKIIVVCIAALLISGSAFASVLQLGGSATWGVPVDFDSSEPVSVSDIEFGKYSIGLDARLNVGFFQFQGEMRGSFSEDLLLKEYGYYLASSLRFDIFFLDLTAGLGMKIGVAKNGETNDWEYNGQSKTDAASVFSTGEFYYRAGLGIDFGPASLELQAMVPTGGASIESMSTNDGRSVFQVIGPQFDRTRISVGITANFF